MKKELEPIENIQWLHASKLDSNDYNPNVVFTPELRLLEWSILKNGWVQPVLINKGHLIIDGFHRWRLSQDSKKLKKKYNGLTPCVVLDINRPEAMLLTIRINRAKGTHTALKMHSIIRELVDVHHYDPQEIGLEIGASREEIDLLYKESVFKHLNLEEYQYGPAWVPEERPRGG